MKQHSPLSCSVVVRRPRAMLARPMPALADGGAASRASGVVCRWFSTTVKEGFKYDDSLDVFGVHGVGGFLGTCVLGIFGHTYFGGFNEVRCITTQPSRTQSHSHHSRHHS